MNKKLAPCALVSLVIAIPATSLASSEKQKVHTACKSSVKQIENRSGRVTLNGIRSKKGGAIAKYRTSINGKIRVVNCVWDRNAEQVSGLFDRTTGLAL
jgi:hypothetical protein